MTTDTAIWKNRSIGDGSVGERSVREDPTGDGATRHDSVRLDSMGKASATGVDPQPPCEDSPSVAPKSRTLVRCLFDGLHSIGVEIVGGLVKS